MSHALHRIVLLGALLCALPATAQTYRFETDSSAPIEIRAELLTVHYEEDYAEYQGQVRAVQGPLHLTAGQLRIHFGDDRSQFSHWTAQDNIVLTSKGKTATGQWLRYDVAQDEMRMGDAVRLEDDRLQLSGALFVLDVESGRARLQARKTGGRARVQFSAPEKSR